MQKKATPALAGDHKHKPTPVPELLAPAGSFEKLVTAIHYGADAVYCGGHHYSLRAHAGLSDDELQQVVSCAHRHAVKVYVTVNMFARNRDFPGLTEYLRHLREIGADAVIVSDPGLLMAARTTIPEMPVHLAPRLMSQSGPALFCSGYECSPGPGVIREVPPSSRLLRCRSLAQIEVCARGDLHLYPPLPAEYLSDRLRRQSRRLRPAPVIMPWWRRSGPDSSSRLRRMIRAPISLMPETCAW
jgi:hypothetical protein